MILISSYNTYENIQKIENMWTIRTKIADLPVAFI